MAKANTKKVQIKVPEVFSAHLAAFLHNNPHVKTVWVNEAGEYSLRARPGFEEYDVEDNLKSLDEYPTSVAPSTEGGETIDQLKKELEDLKAENALLKEALAKATEGGEDNQQ